MCMCVFARVCVCVCEIEREREKERALLWSPPPTTVACVQTHTSFITVSVMRLCSPFRLELMVKLRTLLTVFTLVLKAEARNYGKGVTFPTRIVMFGQSQCTGSAGQSEQTALVGRRDFVENKWFERGGGGGGGY